MGLRTITVTKPHRGRSLRHALTCAWLLFLTCLPIAYGAEFEPPIAVTNVTVVPEPGKIIENAGILVDDGRIQAVGIDLSVPEDARVIDGMGLWAYAGFIDAASHAGISDDPPSQEELARLTDIEQDVVQGPRTAMQRANRRGIWPHRGIRDIYKQDEDKLAAYRKAGFTSALLSPHPAILGGTGDLVQLSGRPLRGATVARDITQAVAFTTGMGSSWPRGAYPGSVMGVVALLRQTYMDAQWYQQSHAVYEANPTKVERPVFDPVLEAMKPLLDQDQTWIFAVDEADEIHHALDLAREFNQKIMILGGENAWKVKDRLAAERVPVIVSPDWDKKPKLAPKKTDDTKEGDNRLASTESWSREWENDFFEPLSLRRERIRLWEERVNNLKTLLDAGVEVAVTGRDMKNPAELWKKLREAMKQGLSSDETLRVLTTSPADLLGVSEQVGSIAEGKLANFSLWTKPFEEEKTKVKYTFVDGIPFEYDVNAPEKKEEEEKDAENGEDEEEEESEETDEEEQKPVDKHPWEWESESERESPISTGGTVVLRNATVLTVTTGTYPDTDVYVVNGKIRQMGRDLQVPDEIKELDLSGYWVMPGIIDPHSHLAISGGVNEWTQSITAEVRVSDVVDHTQVAQHRALAGGVTTIHAMHGSANAIGGQNAVLKLKRNTSPREMLVTSGPRIVKFALGENPTRANTSARGRRFPRTRMGVEAVIRHGFNDALEYKKKWQEYADLQSAGRVAMLPRRDLRLEALNDILSGGIWVHSHCYRGDEMLRLLAVAEDYGIRVGTLQHVLEGYRVAPEMYAHGVAGSTFSDWWGYKKEAYDAIPYNAAMMHNAGVVASLNSDSADVIRYLPLEAEKTMRYGGLSPDDALSLVTINPAIQLGIDTRVGSIETGKDGDFAVFDRHPLDTFAKNVMTLIEGEVYFVHPGLNPEDIEEGPGSTFVPSPPRGLMEIADAEEGFYALVGGTIHTVTEGTIYNGTLVMKNGIITAVSEPFTPPEGTTVIDASGLHVYPGLINSFTNVGMSEIDAIPGTVDTTEVGRYQPDLRAVSAVNPHSAHVGVTLCEGITTAAVWPDGGVVSGQGGLLQLKGWTMPEMLREHDLGMIVDLPTLPAILDDDDKNKRLDEHQEAMEDIELYFEKARHYADVRHLESVSTHSLELEAMTPYVRGEEKVFFRANTYKQILEAVRFAETFELNPVIVGGSEAWKCASMLAEKDVPVIVTSVFGYPYDEFENFDAYFSNPAKLEAAGVDFCIATDGSAYAKRLPIHAGMAVAHGLSEEKAITSITIDAARILGVEQSVGSIEVGKAADIIITTGNPCRASTRTIGMFVAGEPTELTSLHEEHYQKFKNRPDPGLEPVEGLKGPEPMRLGRF